MPTTSELEVTIQDLAKSITELKQGIGFNWNESIIVNNEILNNHNTITLPNNRLFLDLESTSLLVFVNGMFVPPEKYQIINKSTFYFVSDDIIKYNDVINMVCLDKRSLNSNYDNRYLGLARAWTYPFVNESNEALTTITLDNRYSFCSTDKYSVLVYIDGNYISPSHYTINNTRELTFEDITLEPNSAIDIIQLSRVLPNEQYIGYLWGETIIVSEANDTFVVSKKHTFFNDDQSNVIVFVNGKIVKDFEVIDTATIKFSSTIEAISTIDIIQLGYMADINKIRDALDIETLKNLLNIDADNYIQEYQRDKNLGFAGINDEGVIDPKFFDIKTLATLVRNEFIENGWLPYNSSRASHIHSNMDVLWKLQTYNDKLYINGYPVDEKAVEVSINVILTQDMIHECAFDLPEDCDPDRPVTLTIASVPQLFNSDWILIEHDWPERDQISWNNKSLQNVLVVGDTCTVTYYKKVERIQPPLPPEDSGYSHYHENIRVLEALSVNDKNELLLAGKPVYEQKIIETSYEYSLTESDIANKYIDLPSDCDINRAIVVVVSGVTASINEDYRIDVYDPPELDRISWNGLALENQLLSGDTISITYYKYNS